jgi:hypothetical protein
VRQGERASFYAGHDHERQRAHRAPASACGQERRTAAPYINVTEPQSGLRCILIDR